MMRASSIFIIAILFLMSFSCSSERPWIGTYALEITKENKEDVEMFKEMGLVWPEITLNSDGTFITLKTEGNIKITGTYTVKGNTLTLKTLEYDGKPPEGKYAELYSADFKDDFNILMMQGPDKERWVRKEVNEAFMKRR